MRPLCGAGVDTYAHLETYVGGAQIGKAIQKVRLGETEMLTAMALIRVTEGQRAIRIKLTTSAAALLLGDISSVALFVPDSLAKVSVVHF